MMGTRMDRRDFLFSAALWPASAALAAAGVQTPAKRRKPAPHRVVFDLATIERDRVLAMAEKALGEEPITITASHSPRSAGGDHDFFSEGDYWWPDPANPDGPYIQRDGLSNPDNFVAHRQALIRLSMQMPVLAAAYMLTEERRYGDHAMEHLRAWFLDQSTMMNPNLQYAQAIKGRFTGRGTGIIDTIHLVEVAQAIPFLTERISRLVSRYEIDGLKEWFSRYVTWLTTHQYGIDEREAKNNHGTCWVMQVAAFAKFTGNAKLIDYCRDRYKTVLLPNQLAKDGSFPEELRRTKPYGYSLFNLDAMSAVCQILSTRDDNLWTFTLPDGRAIGKAVAYMAPFIKDKKRWPLKPDVMYFDQWPMRQPSLLFAGLALNKPDYLTEWRKLPADSTVDEVNRNFFLRQPLLWVSA
jgi:Alginate lyase